MGETMISVLDFLSNQDRNASGWLLTDIWKFNDTQIENTHTFIQWVFPTNEASRAAPGSPLLDEEKLQKYKIVSKQNKT